MDKHRYSFNEEIERLNFLADRLVKISHNEESVEGLEQMKADCEEMRAIIDRMLKHTPKK